MTLFRDGAVFHEPARGARVFDVSGAGDTVIATLAVMMAAGKVWRIRRPYCQSCGRHRRRQTRYRRCLAMN